jgi:hypothetical protein
MSTRKMGVSGDDSPPVFAVTVAITVAIVYREPLSTTSSWSAASRFMAGARCA